jgi:hypothetical protein
MEINNEKAIAFADCYENDLKELEKVILKFNDRYGKFIIGFQFFKQEGATGFNISPVATAEMYRQVEYKVYDKTFLE